MDFSKLKSVVDTVPGEEQEDCSDEGWEEFVLNSGSDSVSDSDSDDDFHCDYCEIFDRGEYQPFGLSVVSKITDYNKPMVSRNEYYTHKDSISLLSFISREENDLLYQFNLQSRSVKTPHSNRSFGTRPHPRHLKVFVNRNIGFVDETCEVFCGGMTITMETYTEDVTGNINKIMKKVDGTPLYPLKFSNGKQYLVEFLNGICIFTAVSGLKGTIYERIDHEIYSDIDHDIVFGGVPIHIRNVDTCPDKFCDGYVVVVGLKWYKSKNVPTLDLKVIDNEVFDLEKNSYGTVELSDGVYEFVAEDVPNTVKCLREDRSEPNSANVVEEVKKSKSVDHICINSMVSADCKARTLSSNKLDSIIASCVSELDKLWYWLDVDKFMLELLRQQYVYNVGCMYRFLLSVGFVRNRGSYVASRILSGVSSCGRVRYPGGYCTCTYRYGYEYVGTSVRDDKPLVRHNVVIDPGGNYSLNYDTGYRQYLYDSNQWDYEGCRYGLIGDVDYRPPGKYLYALVHVRFPKYNTYRACIVRRIVNGGASLYYPSGSTGYVILGYVMAGHLFDRYFNKYPQDALNQLVRNYKKKKKFG